MTEPEYIEPENLEESQALMRSGGSYLAEAAAMLVQTDERYVEADEFVVEGMEQTKKIKDHCDPRIAQAHVLHKDLCEDKNVFLDPINEAMGIVKMKMKDYKRNQERKKAAEEARLRKIALEKQKEEDHKRKMAEEEKRLAEAEVLHDQGRHHEAEAVLDAPDPEEHKPIPAPIVQPAVPKTKTQLRKDWKITVIDINLVPRELTDLNMARAKARVRSFGDGKVEIPGLLIEEI